MEKFIETVFKDDSPSNTSDRIRDILKGIGMETEEQWNESKVPYCHSLLLEIKELNFSSRGKGLSQELARASAYGELMERLQLGFLGKSTTQKDGSFSDSYGQDLKVPSNQMLDEEIKVCQKLSERLLEWNGEEISPQEILAQYTDKQGNILVTPFVSLTSGKQVYVPSDLRRALYASNGCAAGNTLEEALVQALSEIVERHYRLRIIKENICAPQIPDEVLKKYETPYKIIEYIRSQGYKVWVKDCSLGDSFPVLCVCYVNKATGRYHTHFGAFPIFEIALTRALTETFQGRSLDSFAKYDDFFYSKDAKQFLYNLSQEITFGTATRLPEFFVGQTTTGYNENKGFEEKNNQELLKKCVEFFTAKGYDILARNSSCLGFPTVQVIVPGCSEVYIHRVQKKANDNGYLEYAVRTFRNPSDATMDDMIGFLMHISESKKRTTPMNKAGFLASAKIRANIPKEQESRYYFATLAYVYYAMGNLPLACKNVNEMIKLNVGCNEGLLICIKRYLDMTLQGYSAEQTESLLKLFHSENTVEYLYDCINNNKNPFDEFVLHCNLKCEDSCPIKQSCIQKKVQDVIDLINQKTKELSIDEFAKALQALIPTALDK